MRRAAKQDANSKDLVEYARDNGLYVEYLGLPVDLLVGYKGKFYPVEVKSGKGTYTETQKRFKAQCIRYGLPFVTWRTTDDVDALKNL